MDWARWVWYAAATAATVVAAFYLSKYISTVGKKKPDARKKATASGNEAENGTVGGSGGDKRDRTTRKNHQQYESTISNELPSQSTPLPSAAAASSSSLNSPEDQLRDVEFVEPRNVHTGGGGGGGGATGAPNPLISAKRNKEAYAPKECPREEMIVQFKGFGKWHKLTCAPQRFVFNDRSPKQVHLDVLDDDGTYLDFDVETANKISHVRMRYNKNHLRLVIDQVQKYEGPFNGPVRRVTLENRQGLRLLRIDRLKDAYALNEAVKGKDNKPAPPPALKTLSFIRANAHVRMMVTKGKKN